MKYKSILELDNRIEQIIDKTVKHYYTDWKNYDRLKYMGIKGSATADGRKAVLIARDCGTYLFTIEDLKGRTFPLDCISYYFNQEYTNSHFYFIDVNLLKIDKMSDNDVIQLLRDYEKEKTA